MTILFPPELHIPGKVICKKGGITELADIVKDFGPHGIIVHGSSFEKSGGTAKVLKDLSCAGIHPEFFCRPAIQTDCNQGSDQLPPQLRRDRNISCALSASEATLGEISAVIELGHKIKADWIAGIGGGSVLDLAKAAAGLFHARERPVYYQEGGTLEEKGIPFIALPTTAGSGSEATLNAVIINPEKEVKLSIRHRNFLASAVILDIELLKTAPKSVMAFSGMDALVQAYESFISRNATGFSETLALRAIEMIAGNLPSAVERSDDGSLHAMLVGSFFSGLAFSHSRLGVIHGIAHPLGVLYDVPHGLVCSVCFIPSILLNRNAMGEKYGRMSRAVGTDFIRKVEDLQETLGIRSPFKGKEVIEKEKIVVETLKSGSTAANPKPVTREDVEFLLREIF